MKKFLSILGWIITIPIQFALGYMAAVIALGAGQGAMPISAIYMWVGTSLGVFAVGAIALLLRRAVQPKRFGARLLGAAVGVLIPYAIMLILGMTQGFDSMNQGLGLILPILAALLGLIGFYVAGGKVKKK